MLTNAALISALVCASGFAGAHPSEATPQKRRARVQAVFLDVEAVDRDAVNEALELRLPGRQLLVPGAERPIDVFFAYVQIRPAANETHDLQLAIILSDGRAYYRVLAGTPTPTPRLVASTVSNLLAGIEEDTVEPDAKDVPVPPPPRPTTPPATRQPGTTPPPTPRRPRPSLGVGIQLNGGVVAMVGPPSPTGIAGHGGLGVRLRWPKGVVAAFDFRTTAAVRGQFSLVRFRIGAGAGYSWRRGQFDLTTTASLSLEPWIVTEQGSRTNLFDGDGVDRPASFLLGGFVGVSPAYVAKIHRDKLAIRIGPRIELGGSALPSADGGVARISEPIIDEGTESLFRVGGLELVATVAVGLWWSVPTGT